MGEISNYLELELLDHVFGAAAYPAPATLYIALFTAAPSDTGGGTEVSGGSYARVAVTNNAANFPAASAGAKANGTVITFAAASASWGTVTHFGIFDALTVGNLLAHGALAVSDTVDSGDTEKIAVGELDVTMSTRSTYLANKLLDLVLSAAAYTAPVTLYVALSTTTPTDAGASVTEPAGGAYARVAVTNNATNFPAASAGAKSNGVAITFPAATGSWGTVTHYPVYDASSAGNMMGWAALTTSKTINTGNTAAFAIGEFDLTAE